MSSLAVVYLIAPHELNQLHIRSTYTSTRTEQKNAVPNSYTIASRGYLLEENAIPPLLFQGHSVAMAVVTESLFSNGWCIAAHFAVVA
jgi:hypothetical protein